MQPAPQMNATQQWYLQCFEVLSKHLRRAPSIDEFSAYVRRDVSTTWRALNRLAALGVLRRTKSRRFALATQKAATK